MAKQFSPEPFHQGGHSFSAGTQRCFHTHPPLKIGDTGLLVYGGSCSTPVVHDADVYIGFDYSMSATTASYPWQRTREEIYFHITDGQPPKDAAQFKKMISWVALQIQAGKKVHAGCIGGHGRTGLFLSALIKHMTGMEDSTTYVRENYCKKAVESSSQVQFLFDHFGIKKTEGSKAHLNHAAHQAPSGKTFGSGKRANPPADTGKSSYSGQGNFFHDTAPVKSKYQLGKDSVNPVPSRRSIWSN